MATLRLAVFFLAIGLVSVRHLEAQSFMDLTYGDSGWVLTDIAGGHDMYYDLALQPDGKLLATGFASGLSDSSLVLVSRYEQNGEVDASWAGSGHFIFQPAGQDGEARSIAVQPDGKVLVAGWARLNGHPHVMVARFSSAGDPDLTFGVDGTVGYEVGDSSQIADMVLQSDGLILLCGLADIVDYPFDYGDHAQLLMRLYSDGGLDTTFADEGIHLFDPSVDGDGFRAIALQADNKIIAVGDTGNWSHACAVRFNSDGTIDTSFGDGDGMFSSGYYGRAVAVATLLDGSILMGSVEGILSNYDDATVTKLDSNGLLDPAFGIGGLTYVQISPDWPLFTSAMLVQDDGNIVIGGVSTGPGGYPDDFFLLRFQPSGALDNTFGDGGIIWSTPYHIQNGDYVMGMVREPSGRFLLGGHWYNNVDSDAAIAAIIPGTVGVEERKFVEELRILPNPACDRVEVILPARCRGEIVLADALGRMVRSITVGVSDRVQVEIGDLTNGSYWLIFFSAERRSATPLIVQH